MPRPRLSESSMDYGYNVVALELFRMSRSVDQFVGLPIFYFHIDEERSC